MFGSSLEQLAVLIEHGVHEGVASKDNRHKLFRRSGSPSTLCNPHFFFFFFNGVTSEMPIKQLEFRVKACFYFYIIKSVLGSIFHLQRLGKSLR